MHDKDLYAKILGITSPWSVTDVALRLEAGEVEVTVEAERGALRCPTCGAASPGYDTRPRRWRHLDTCQYRTILRAHVPRVECAEHGVAQITVPWAAEGSHFTVLFEAVVIDWLGVASLAAVARQLQLTWDEVDGIMGRAVQRGLARRQFEPPTRIGVDETAFQKRFEYVTVVCDLDRARVLHVADGHSGAALAGFFAQLGPAACAALKVIAMDMWRPYLTAILEAVPNAKRKIAFDKYHVAALLGTAVDQIRRREQKALRAEGDMALRGTKYWWLTNPARMDAQRRAAFSALRRIARKTARAWALKDVAMGLWRFVRRGWAMKAWSAWLQWAQRCQLTPMLRAVKTIQKYLWGILNAIETRTTNALAEGMNSRIQELKRRACGYRNRERFRNAIYFHLGGLSLYPEPTQLP
jgi:transposase